jgi:enhancing lycopene biosynthesis protein 2
LKKNLLPNLAGTNHHDFPIGEIVMENRQKLLKTINLKLTKMLAPVTNLNRHPYAK